jgi:hypothetical protein
MGQMEMVNEVERQFRALHEDSVQEYEDEVKRWKDGLDEQSKRDQADEEEIRDSLKKSGTDLTLLDRRAKRAEDELNTYLDSTRPALINRASDRVADFKQRGLESSLMAESCQTQISPYAVSQMAPDRSYLEGIEGESGNPWIFPSNPGQINIWDNTKGSGWGCWATAYPPPPITTVWFTFVPDHTARWELSPIFVFHGFYIMRANDGVLTCKFSEVNLEAKVDIFQYFWKGAKTYKLIDTRKSNVNHVKFYDRTEWLWDTTILRAGDRVWVKVGVSVQALASGGGSYAEINFSNGTANYIEPLLMTAQKL